MSATPPRVLISYSHDSPEHEARVLALADRLREDGIDCRLDQYEPWPKEGWTLWMERQIKESDYVVLVGTETYRRRVDGEEEPGKGLGVCWEGRLIRTLFYEAQGINEKYLPVLPPDGHPDHLPTWLRDHSRFYPFEDTGYEQLYRRLTNQPATPASGLGTIKKLPSTLRRQRHSEFRAAPVWHVPHAPTPFFTGREEVLTQLRAELLRSGRVALCGIAGVGKTQTARQYVHLHRDAYPYVFWVSAASRDELLAGYASLARELALPLADEKEIEVVAKSALRWLDSHDGWLLVLDNADEPEVLRALLPARGRGHLLITMRPLFTGELAEKVEIKSMPGEEGASFLLRRAGRISEEEDLAAASEPDRNAALAICSEVGGLPLALDQAGAYLEETGSAPERYLGLFRRNKGKLLARRGGLDPEHESVAVTFSVAHERLAEVSPEAADLLRLCAFLAPDAIPEALFEQGAAELDEPLRSALSDDLSQDEMLMHTRRFAMLDRDPNSHALTLHRLLQDVIREGMTEEEQRLWTEQVVNLLAGALPDPEFENWPYCESLMPHVVVTRTWIDKWQLTSVAAGRLAHQGGWYLNERSRFQDGERFCRQALAIRRGQPEPINADLARSLNNLAMSLQGQGKYYDAAPLYVEASSICDRVLGPDHPDTASNLNNLAVLLKNQGKHGEAEPLHRRALAIRAQALGPDHPDTASSLNNLAGLLQDQGKLGEAEPLYRRSLAIWEQALGPDHPDTATSLNNLARLLHDQGKLEEAESFYRRALAIRAQALGPDHPDTATSLNNLAGLLQDQGKLGEAEPLYRRSLAMREQALGPDHPDTASSLNNLATLLGAKNLHVQAETLLRRSLAINELALGKTHPTVATVFVNLAAALRRMGRHREARTYEVRARRIREQHARENAAPTSASVAAELEADG